MFSRYGQEVLHLFLSDRVREYPEEIPAKREKYWC
jgi:hypothetical protein